MTVMTAGLEKPETASSGVTRLNSQEETEAGQGNDVHAHPFPHECEDGEQDDPQ